MAKVNFNIQSTSQFQMIDITHQVEKCLQDSKISDGLCHVFIPHTTAGVTINEGADPDVQSDIIRGLDRMVPADIRYDHLEGNSRAHIMATLTGSSVTVSFTNNMLILGTWQKIYFCEYDGPRTRNVFCTIIST